MIAFLCAVQVDPGLASWVILSRPCGTALAGNVYPALACWATFRRPFGTKFRKGDFSRTRPCGANHGSNDTRPSQRAGRLAQDTSRKTKGLRTSRNPFVKILRLARPFTADRGFRHRRIHHPVPDPGYDAAGAADLRHPRDHRAMTAGALPLVRLPTFRLHG